MTIDLPQELIDTILDELAADPSSSSSRKNCALCALVCRAWVPRSRSHLFETCWLCTSCRISEFRDLLRSPYCTFLPHVRNIGTDSDSELSRMFDDQFAADLRGLTRVCSLQMTLDTGPADSIIVFFYTTFPSITRLILSGTTTLVQLVSTICLFPELQRLQIDLFIPSPTSASVTKMSKTPPPALHSLALCGRSVGPILAWLHSVGHLHKIRCLRLPCLIMREVEVYQALQNLSGNLPPIPPSRYSPHLVTPFFICISISVRLITPNHPSYPHSRRFSGSRRRAALRHPTSGTLSRMPSIQHWYSVLPAL
ncbi:hypothetical protein MSAN_00197800 [Mycena sanguinolenta]|uniref:F-box domain-containing protein n=1 Tax=Mycena sanguinolenta TaxID=230812 RepID=A0A8H6ZEW6_9AGAR|nr:hypothetical protein MSAN_00197800 [Mycena sanguinolenta]